MCGGVTQGTFRRDFYLQENTSQLIKYNAVQNFLNKFLYVNLLTNSVYY